MKNETISRVLQALIIARFQFNTGPFTSHFLRAFRSNFHKSLIFRCAFARTSGVRCNKLMERMNGIKENIKNRFANNKLVN